MAIFTPYQNAPADKQYAPPKEIDVGRPDATLSTALTGAAKVFDLGVKAVDDINKSAIDKEIREGVDAERNASINAGLDLLYPQPQGATTPATTPVSGSVEPTEVPAGVQQGVRQMNMYAQANRQGKLEDVPYFGNMQAIAQRVISQYPGYAEYIHQKTASILGTNPANAQRSAIQSSLQQLYGARDKEQERNERFLEQNAKHFINSKGEFDEVSYNAAVAAIKSGDPRAISDVKGWIAKQEANEHGIDVNNKKLSQIAATRKIRSDEAEASFHDVARLQLNRVANQMTFTIQGRPTTYSEIVNLVDKIESGAIKADPALLAEIGAATRQFKQTYMQAIRTEGMRVNKEWGGSYYSLIGDKTKADAIIQQYADLFNPVIESVGTGNLNAATRTATVLKGVQDVAALEGLKIPIISDWAKLGALPQQAQSAVIQHQLTIGTPGRPGVGIQEEISQQLRQLRMMEMGSTRGDVGSLATILERYSAATNAPARRMTTQQDIQDRALHIRQSVNDVQQMLINPEATLEQRVAAARVLSDPRSTEFFTKLNKNQQMTMFRQVYNKSVTDQMFEMSRGDPELWDNYQTFVQQTFKRLNVTQLSTITQGAQLTQGLNLKFNEETGQIETNNRPNRQSLTGARRDSTPQVDTVTQQAVTEINKGLQTYKYVLEKAGVKLDEKELQALGINLAPPPKEPTSGSPKGSGTPSKTPLRDMILKGSSLVTPAFADEGGIPPASDVIRDSFGQISDQPIPYEFGSQEQQRLLDTGRQRQQQGFPQPR